jgi:hypothetical protein
MAQPSELPAEYVTVALSNTGRIVEVTVVVSPYLIVLGVGVSEAVRIPRLIVTVTVLVSLNQLAL